MTQPLTERQRKILEFITEYLREEGRPPSIPEIALHFGMKSPNGVAKHLAALEAKGYIDRGKGARSIRLPEGTSVDKNVNYLPLVGRIAAGSPILAEENVEACIPMPSSMALGREENFLLEVSGDSMIEDGILPGDLVIVSPGGSVLNGDIVAVRIEDGATVKRFYRENGRIRLQPANERYEPIILTGEQEAAVIGKVVGLIRDYTSKRTVKW
jgi:repressor LexA